MCLIIYRKDVSKPLDLDIISAAARQNQDGFGITYLDDLRTLRTMDYQRIPKLLEEPRPFVAHFRYATRGAISKNTCHPFRFSKGWLYSNGTVDGLGDKTTCDTQVVAEFLDRTPKRHWSTLLAMTPTRFAVVEKDGKVSLYGTWVERDGILYSKDPDIRVVHHYGYGSSARSKIIDTHEDYWEHEKSTARKALPASSTNTSSVHSFTHNPTGVASPGLGYRFLRKGEIVQARDEYYALSNGKETWHPSNLVGVAVDGIGTTYRRRIVASPLIPDGYVELQEGDRLRKGDLWCLKDAEPNWAPTTMVGCCINANHVARSLYARPLESHGGLAKSLHQEEEIDEITLDSIRRDLEEQAEQAREAEIQEFYARLHAAGFSPNDWGCYEWRGGDLVSWDQHHSISALQVALLDTDIVDFLTGDFDPEDPEGYATPRGDEPDPECWEGSEYLAVYGTLKRGRGNHALLGDSTFIGEGRTLEHLRMVTRGCPFLYSEEHELGNRVAVEVYEVLDPKVRARVDSLEGHPDWYRRQLIDILMPDASVMKCWCYLMDGDDCPPQPSYQDRY